MTKAEFNVLFERFAIPAIEEICANNSLITPKNYDISKEKVYAEYEKMRHKYKEAIFSTDK